MTTFPRRSRPSSLARPLRRTGHALAILLICGFFLFPFAWLIATSFKRDVDTFAIPPVWLASPTFANYRHVLGDMGFASYFMNSAVVTLVSSLLVMALSVPAAYSLVRLRVRGAQRIAYWIISLRMLPPITAVVPLVLVFQQIDLYGSRLSLVLAYILMNAPLAVWMLIGFFLDFPADLEDAARVDGCSTLGVLVRIVLPVARGGLATTTIMVAIFAWNEFLFAQLLTTPETRTLPVSVTQFMTIAGTEWGPMSAAAMVILGPIFAAVLLIQRHIVRGLTMGAVHGA